MPQQQNFGYQGFRSWGNMPISSMKPGESNFTRSHKFVDVGHGVVYANGTPAETLRDETSAGTAFSVVKQGDYVVPDRRGISVNFSKGLPASKPFIAQSVHRADFTKTEVDCGAYAALSEDALIDAFDSIATGAPEIPISMVKPCILKACGGDVPPRVLDKFGKYFELQADGGVSLDALMQADAVVRTGALPPSLGGVTLKSGAPEWLVSSRQVNTSVVKRQMKSSYQKDLGKDGELPSERPFVAKTGMASTTEDLFDGTTKDTHHIPGYCGHIPASKRNPHVVKHGDAEDPRDKATSLRLYHRHNVPGYTGHQPVNARNDLGERLSGAHPATTSGSAALGLVL